MQGHINQKDKYIFKFKSQGKAMTFDDDKDISKGQKYAISATIHLTRLKVF